MRRHGVGAAGSIQRAMPDPDGIVEAKVQAIEEHLGP
jgi:hypothetical protein